MKTMELWIVLAACLKGTEEPVGEGSVATATELRKLEGRWQRPDGGYVIEIRRVGEGATTMEAAYCNPRPIHVARGEASREGGTLKVLIASRWRSCVCAESREGSTRARGSRRRAELWPVERSAQGNIGWGVRTPRALNRHNGRETMKHARRAAPWMLALIVMLAGCAKAYVPNDQPYTGPKVARPGRIIVHDFAASPADIPPGSLLAKRYAQPATPPTPQELAVGRQLGADVAASLVQEIQAMGLPAVRAKGQPAPRRGDLVIMGYFEAVDSGDANRRVVLGFGSGSAHVRTAVEGYLMTDQGLKRVGSSEADAGGDQMPGLAVPMATAVATRNPIGLIVSGAVKAEGEATGRTTIEGAGRRTAQIIAERLRDGFQRQGWI
jgi:hypothetical protein